MIHQQAAISGPDPASVVSKATLRASEALGLRQAELAGILGLSPSSVSRLADGRFDIVPGAKPYELALLLIRLFRALSGVLGNEADLIRQWMRSPNLALGGVPAELIRSAQGLVLTVAYADSARARL
jgi:transcriptional regulator with XRE-family HTH domain